MAWRLMDLGSVMFHPSRSESVFTGASSDSGCSRNSGSVMVARLSLGQVPQLVRGVAMFVILLECAGGTGQIVATQENDTPKRGLICVRLASCYSFFLLLQGTCPGGGMVDALA